MEDLIEMLLNEIFKYKGVLGQKNIEIKSLNRLRNEMDGDDGGDFCELFLKFRGKIEENEVFVDSEFDRVTSSMVELWVDCF
jgi:hypothetical protein